MLAPMKGSNPNPWEALYRDYWGERWPLLKAALVREPAHVGLLNPWCAAQNSQAHLKPIPHLELSGPSQAPQAIHGFKSFYPLDLASLYPPAALGVIPGEKVLDLCAAPGGKALALVILMKGQGELVCNEPSRSRRDRLKRVLQDYLPETVRKCIQMTGTDGALMGKRFPESFDKILVDAPCSGEGHMLRHPKEAKTWTAARSKNLAQRQYAILRGAWVALKPGGSLVYSTCSVSPLENDGVVARLVKKQGAEAKVLPLQADRGEASEWGWQILPDRDPPWGPSYFAKILKTTKT